MVDHRADAEGGLGLFGPADEGRGGWPAPTLGQRLGDWFAARPRLIRADRAGRFMSTHRVPLVLSAFWIALMATYAVGYFGVFYGDDAPVRSVPSLDLLFFAIALTGPLAMLWIASAMIRRAQVLSEAISGQSETALALAATVANLQESVDDLGESAWRRMDASLKSLEKNVAGSISALDDSVRVALEDTRVALAMRGAELDKLLAETETRTREQLGERISAIDAQMALGAEKLNELSVAQHELIASRLEESARKVEAALGARAAALGERLVAADAQVSAGIDRRAEQLASSMQAAQDAQTGRLDQAAKRLETAITAMQTRVTRALESRAGAIDRALAEESTRLGQAMQATADIVDGDLRQLLDDVRRSLESASGTLAANPPASAEDLTALLGAAASGMISPDREIIGQSVERLGRIEEQARQLVARIDRTARLAVPRDRVRQAPAGTGLPGLPFADLPPTQGPAAVDWDLVVSALDLTDGDAEAAMAEARRVASADAGIGQLLPLADTVVAALGEEGIDLDDLAPDPVPAECWSGFAAGRRGPEIAPLVGITDELAARIARNLLRRDPDLRAEALRFVGLFSATLARMASETGPAPLLVELGDSRAGRAFQLLAHVTGAFRAAI